MHKEVQNILTQYLDIFPQEKERLGDLSARLPFNKSIFSRKDFIGHITAGAFIFAADMKSVLLIHHKQLQKLLQPGGHVEREDKSLLDACVREVSEETGIQDVRFLSFATTGIPIDIDIHTIPYNAKKGELEHRHYDFCFACISDDNTAVTIQEAEVSGYVWLSIDELSKYPHPRFQKILQKVHLLVK
jgi:8-oxo-dGTP pyrophosphatase MutT (NUDIX family)